MDSYQTQNFDPCIIAAANQQRDIMQSVNSQTQVEQVQSQENHDTLQQQQQQHQQTEQTHQAAQIQSNAPQSMNLTPVRLPAILDGEYFVVTRVEDTSVTVRCLQCQRLLNGNLKSTGNFLSHIKRVHPFLIEKIKGKSNQRKPATVYVDSSSTEKCSEIGRLKRVYAKCYKAEEYTPTNEEPYEQPADWNDAPLIQRPRRPNEEPENTDVLRVSHNNAFLMEDEYDAIGRNVAAKLRNMRLDQRIIAEKLLNDILFEAQLGNLHRDSSIHV